jgi:carbonic anhydrase
MQSPIDIKTLSSATKAIDILNIAVLDWQFDHYFVTSFSDGSADHATEHGTVSLSAGPPKLFLDLPVNSRFSDPAGGGGGRRRLLQHAYPPKPTESYDGHSFTVQALGTPTLFVDGAKYALREMRTHTPSEHTVDGARFDMELQLVHTLDGGGGGGGAARQVVVAVLFSAAGGAGAEPPFLGELAATIGMEHFGSSPRWLARDFSFKAVAGALRGGARMTSYYKYRGSLTQPPCTEGVTWFVVKHPLTVGAATLGAFSALQGRNNRPTQPSHDRLVEFTP